MKRLPYRDIVSATTLTRAGDVTGATKMLQAALTSAVAPVDRSISRAAVPTENAQGRFLSLVYRSEDGARPYKLYVPSAYNGQPCPLILMMHGCTQTAADFAAGTRMNELAEEDSFFVAYPEQPASANPQKCWNWFKRSEQQRDRGEPLLIAGLTHQIMQEYGIDRDRVYVAGMSAGAAAAAVLGTAYPDIFAAVGVHSGLVCGLAYDVSSAFAAMKSGKGARRRENNEPIPTIVFHGDGDTTVNKRNGDRFAEPFANSGYTKRVQTGRSSGGRSYTQTLYSDATGRDMLEQWSVHGTAHAWSGGSAAGSYTDPLGPDASREMVRFFLSHRLAERADRLCLEEKTL